ncbi:unnamed protein product [Adineta steineri]|uniref:gamma-glutamylcyclotransferase n=1 Tax=Adineta steineri TaxID=433720 RepID=A0A813XZ86_9BILA|nr:unnamed protein product [Adineta steineri]CAF0875393.1 unnamed protein product [Adineta steineri]CAF3990895.1 unnamed protein product [Adineta steineri]
MTNTLHRLNSSTSEANFKLSCDVVHSKIIRHDQSLIDSILAHDNPQEPIITLSDGQKYFWYLAIGSMNNPISLYLRNLIPIISYPAICLNHRVIFRGVGGMADIESCEGSEFDGVVHLLSEEQMNRLDKMEMSYERIIVPVVNYQNQSHSAYAYKMTIASHPDNLPSERYLDIIVKGCEYYGVRPDYIKRLREEQAVTPRKEPHTYQCINDVPSDVFYTTDDLAKHNGSDPNYPIWICINGKILEHVGLPPSDSPEYEAQKQFHTIIQSRFAGREADFEIAKAIYEPLHKLPLNEEDLTDEHRAMLEDHHLSMRSRNDQNNKYWKPIGRLRRSNKITNSSL